MKIEEIVKELKEIIGEGKFIQFAFYISPNEQTGLHNPWVKVESEIEVNQYRAWQSRTEDTLEGNLKNCMEMIRKELVK